MVLVLLAASTIFTFTVAQTGILEQRMSANEYHHKTLRLAAESGLEQSIAWLGYNLPEWDKASDNAGPQSAQLTSPIPATDASSNNHYAVDIQLRRRGPYSPYITILSTAKDPAKPHIVAPVRQIVAPNGGPIHTGIDLPPLIVGGCLGSSSGNASIYPRDWNHHRLTGPAIVATGSSTPECLDTDSLNLHGGTIQSQASSGNTWDYVFRKSRDEIRAMAEQEINNKIPNTARTFIWENSSEDYHRSWGSPSHPVILVFSSAAGCPRFFDTVTIYGIVYVDGQCPAPIGLGGLDVYGSVAIAGNISDIRSGTSLHHFSEVANGPLRFIPDGIARVPGTWRDF